METYLLLGCNLGNCRKNLAKAEALLALTCGTIVRRSSVYRTEAWGLKEQPDFYNLALKLKTDLAPRALLAAVKSVEVAAGRKNGQRWGPRELDIDILLYGSEIVALPELKIPHPLLCERRFALMPLCEIASTQIHPQHGQTIAQLLQACKDTSAVVRVD